MAGELKNYSPKDVSVIVGGHIVSGYADGAFVSVARNVDLFAVTIGADGEGTRTKSADRSGRFTITLKQTSESNAVLAALNQADELNNGGLVPVIVRDSQGNSLHTCEQAWIVKAPDAGYGKDLENREWVLETHSLTTFSGGN